MPSLPEIGSSLPEVVLRTAIVYLFIVLVLRISGKREVGQMSVLELIVILVISDAVRTPWSATTRRCGAAWSRS